MQRTLALIIFLLAGAMLQTSLHAFINATYLSTTVTLTNSTDAHVFETINLDISNSSVAQYNQARQAVNLSLDSWRQVIGSQLLVQHILKGGIYNFTYLPGPLTITSTSGGSAVLTMSYNVKNVSTSVNIAPRQFEYSMNDSIFNFMHTASGQALFKNSRLTIIVPDDADILAVYPAPDSPQVNNLGKYANSTFSWFLGEPLQKFSLVYTITQTPQQEVLGYLKNIYANYRDILFATLGVLLIVGIAYIYFKMLR